MTQLSVNVNKLATLRNSREKNLPDVTLLSEKILTFGAHGITIHPRPDGRHIRLSDVYSLRDLVASRNSKQTNKPVEFNIEGFPSDEFLKLMQEIKPHQCTLVPDPPEALTSNAGWNLVHQQPRLQEVLATLRAAKVRSSLFIDPKDLTDLDGKQESALAKLHPDRIELYTEEFANHAADTEQRSAVTAVYQKAAEIAKDLKIGVNAGHDLNQNNLGSLIKAIPWISEVSIGHALICEALELGLKQTIGNYLKILQDP